MTSGVSTGSVSKTASWSAITGTWDADYPVGNLGDLTRPTKVARITPAGGAVAFAAVLATTSDVQFIGLVHHTLPVGATFRVRLYADASMTTLVHDSGLVAVWPPLSSPMTLYRSVRPFILDVAYSAAAVRLDLAGLTDPFDIGGVEIAEWWEWPGISPDANFGFKVATDDIQLVGGASEGVEQFLPRTYDGQIDYLALKVAASQGLDFQKSRGLGRPFVFVEDYEDGAASPRTCFLARNTELPASVGVLYRHDRFQFRLMEHIR